MAKERQLANFFEGLAKTNDDNINETSTKHNDNDNKILTSDNVNVNETLSKQDDNINNSTANNLLNLLEDKTEKKLKGFHLDKDIYDLIDKLSEKKPRGYQSELANAIFREVFENAGLLKKK